MHPDGVDYTFYRPNCAASRLDRYYIPLTCWNMSGLLLTRLLLVTISMYA